ncbi:MAG: hypothetical protein ABL999_12130 [Pyrinomonadaceae bacterium]
MNEVSGNATVHGVLVSIDSTGVLIVGDSGSGKSECALRLIDRGHKLVADDVVEITSTASGLVGSAPTHLRRLLEIRDLGIVDVEGIFGVGAFDSETSVDAVVEIAGTESGDIGRFRGSETTEILGTTLPKFRLIRERTSDLALLIEISVKILNQPHFVRALDSIKRPD